MTYSQFGQDSWVLSHITEPSTFLDIGAGDGVRLSNTKLLEEQGWTGVCVEPSSDFQKLVRTRKCRLADWCAWREDGGVEFVEMPDPVFSGVPSLLSNHQEIDGRPIQSRLAATIQSILGNFAMPLDIGYLSLDTEGSEAEILEGFDWSHTFRLATIEHNYVKARQRRIRELMESHGYLLVAKVYVDDWYMRAVA